MLQQTRVQTAIGYYRDFLVRFPDIHALAGADLEDVLKCWEGLGYYARARHLHETARIVVGEMDGEIPSDYRILRSLPGIGDYIASAVGSISYDLPFPVLDGNVKRLLARLFRVDAPVPSSEAIRVFRERIEELLDPEEPGRFNQAMMELGALVCRPRRPRCSECPVAEFCQAYRRGLQEAYPVPSPKKTLPEHLIVSALIYQGDRLLITRRPILGLLGGLWELPGGKVEGTESAEEALHREIREETGLSIEIDRFLTRIRHAYSHFRIVMDVFACRYKNGEVVLRGPIDHRWIKVREIDDYPFPAANRKFMSLVVRFMDTMAP